MERYECKKCGHSWKPKTERIPQECPNCKNRNWQGQKRTVDKQLAKV